MASAGFKVRGAYHFGHPNSDAAAQAHHFVSAVGATQTHTTLLCRHLRKTLLICHGLVTYLYSSIHERSYP